MLLIDARERIIRTLIKAKENSEDFHRSVASIRPVLFGTIIATLATCAVAPASFGRLVVLVASVMCVLSLLDVGIRPEDR